MDATHARPMTAYAALCAAAVVVLAQGLSTSTPVADTIAQTGRPGWTYGAPVTLAAKHLADRVGDLSTVVVSAAVAPAVAAAPAARTPAQQEATRAAISSTGSASARSRVAKPVTIEPATQGFRTTGPSKVQERASVDRTSHRASAKDVRKAKRSSAKDVRKAHRAARRR
ncbi:hypothetical protein [Nocardioides sp.]|uniref:hypothetical protein n=1 Tax=Nocardioides sp. TaxID=35761 RepID=UPI002C55B204|nr:hypothetical protein [Nocardioides sp.]HSX69284.1 hypothetical protein [Nocardioides sp.]